MFSEKQVERLIDVANVGCHHGYVFDARVIYESILASKPNFTPAKISLAFSHIVVDDFDNAKNLLTEIIGENDMDIDAKVMLGLCYLLAKEKELAHELLKPLSADTTTEAGKLAADLLLVSL